MKKAHAARGRAKLRTPEQHEPLRQRVMEAALASFMDKGFAGTSTLEIASRANISKRDLYLVATSKSELLRQAVAERVGRLRPPLELPFAAVEAETAPEIARMLYALNRDAGRAALSRALSRAQADGFIRAGDPAVQSGDFLALLWGDLLLRLVMRLADPPPHATLERRAREATEKL